MTHSTQLEKALCPSMQLGPPRKILNIMPRRTQECLSHTSCYLNVENNLTSNTYMCLKVAYISKKMNQVPGISMTKGSSMPLLGTLGTLRKAPTCVRRILPKFSAERLLRPPSLATRRQENAAMSDETEETNVHVL